MKISLRICLLISIQYTSVTKRRTDKHRATAIALRGKTNILHSAQHGFIKHRSTCTNLLESFNDWSISVQSRKQVTIDYIDFTKAFDLVSRQKLFGNYTRVVSALIVVAELFLWSYARDNKNLAIVNRSRVSCAHNTSRAFICLNITP